jgi:hypothetical protein
MTWNYRVVESKGVFQIHEVYYNDKGEITAMSEDPIAPAGETVEELKNSLKYYRQAVKRPILKREEIEFGDMDIE